MKVLNVLACAFACCPPGRPGFKGGEDTLGWNLVKEIARHHRIWVITSKQNQEDIELELKEHPIKNLAFYFVDFPKWLRPMLKIQGGHQIYYHLWQIYAYLSVRKLTLRISFDLFHHITYANDWMASYIGALLPIPYIRGPCGGSHRTPKGFQSEYPLSGQVWEKVRSLGQMIYKLDPFFYLGQNKARAIMVCTSESVANIPARLQNKVHVFPVSGVSVEDFDHHNKSIQESPTFKVMTAGSLIRVKGMGLAIKAFARFSATHPDAHFSIIGSGPEETRLKTMVKGLRIQDKVSFHPAVSRRELLAIMSSHDVFLFPSLRDGGGTVVIEAMAVGTPVVCLDAGGPGTHVTIECGVKVAPLNPEQAIKDLSNALSRLCQDDALRLNLGEAARFRAKMIYRWDRLGDRLMKIYQNSCQTSEI